MVSDYDVTSKMQMRPLPGNKGKLIGPKPPLRPSQVWAIRTRLQMEDRKRDLALFNLAIESKLRGCDVFAVRVEDVAPSGYALDRATIDGSAGEVRTYRSNPVRHRRLSEADGQKAGSGSVLRPGPFAWPHNQAVCEARQLLGGEHRPRPAPIRDTFPAPYEGRPDLPQTGNLRAV
jgi:hypothetical protein